MMPETCPRCDGYLERFLENTVVEYRCWQCGRYYNELGPPLQKRPGVPLPTEGPTYPVGPEKCQQVWPQR